MHAWESVFHFDGCRRFCHFLKIYAMSSMSRTRQGKEKSEIQYWFAFETWNFSCYSNTRQRLKLIRRQGLVTGTKKKKKSWDASLHNKNENGSARKCKCLWISTTAKFSETNIKSSTIWNFTMRWMQSSLESISYSITQKFRYYKQ